MPMTGSKNPKHSQDYPIATILPVRCAQILKVKWLKSSLARVSKCTGYLWLIPSQLERMLCCISLVINNRCLVFDSIRP